MSRCPVAGVQKKENPTDLYATFEPLDQRAAGAAPCGAPPSIGVASTPAALPLLLLLSAPSIGDAFVSVGVGGNDLTALFTVLGDDGIFLFLFVDLLDTRRERVQVECTHAAFACCFVVGRREICI